MFRRALGFARRLILRLAVLFLLLILSLRWINPPITFLQATEWQRTGQLNRDWITLESLPPHLPAAFVAAEDANFCAHWGFDFQAIRDVLESGQSGGASTITQQTVKNVFLWPQRSWLRKGLEAGLSPVVELLWGKRRILEVYLNVAEMDEATFGVEAASQTYFQRSAAMLTASQSSRLASVLPNPKGRSAAKPNRNQQRRLRTIQDGAATILKDGRADCFL